MPEDTARRLAERVDAIRRGAAMQGLRLPGDVPTLLDLIDALTAERDALRRQLQELWAPSWSCEDCGWPWPMTTPPASTDECDSCGGPMKEDDDG